VSLSIQNKNVTNALKTLIKAIFPGNLDHYNASDVAEGARQLRCKIWNGEIPILHLLDFNELTSVFVTFTVGVEKLCENELADWQRLQREIMEETAENN